MIITEPAPAKINLALHIRRRRPDGYHDLETLFAFARDGDVVSVEPATETSFTIIGSFAAALSSSPLQGRGGSREAAEGEGQSDASADNLVTRARDAFRATFTCPPVAITLEKNLPVASGIGGGSADAAATLRALARLHGIDPDAPELFAIAARLGADVPACLLGRPALGVGKGDQLAPLPRFGDLPLLLINPRVPLATAPMFAAWDGVDRGGIAREGGVLARAVQGRNDFTVPAVAAAPVIAEVLTLLERCPGATLARMSGSGATCFAIFESGATRDDAATAADARGWWTLRTQLA